jgi:hypothetical protein
MHSKAADVKAAFGNGTDNTDVGFYTIAASSKVVALPDGWVGQFVRITPSVDMYYFFSSSPTASVVIGTAADDGSFAATRGEFVAAGSTLPVWVPYCAADKHVYFARIGSTTGGVTITKASGKPGNNTEAGE